MRFQWNGGPANYLICYACRLTEDFGAELYQEAAPPLDSDGEKQSGLVYIPSPLATERLGSFVEKLVSLSLLELDQLKKKIEEQQKQAKHLELFFQTKGFIIKHELLQRFNTLKKRREKKQAARKVVAPPRRKAQTQDKLMQLAIGLARSGVTPEQLLEILKKRTKV